MGCKSRETVELRLGVLLEFLPAITARGSTDVEKQQQCGWESTGSTETNVERPGLRTKIQKSKTFQHRSTGQN